MDQMVKPGWFHGARGGERPVQARLRQPGLGPFQFGGKTRVPSLKGAPNGIFISDNVTLLHLQVIVYMLVSGGREPFWDGSDIRAIKNTLKKEVADNSEVASDQNFNKIPFFLCNNQRV